VSDRIFDEGLQVERTALAWRRTSLAMAVAAVGAGRLAAPVIGAVAVGLAGLGLLQALAVSVTARRRYVVAHRSLTFRGDLAGLRQGGLPIAALAGSCLTVGLLALVFVLGSAAAS
jgi:putative membrane protein